MNNKPDWHFWYPKSWTTSCREKQDQAALYITTDPQQVTCVKCMVMMLVDGAYNTKQQISLLDMTAG